MTRHECRWLRAPGFALLIATTAGCGASAGPSGIGVPMNERPPAARHETARLYVIPSDSLRTLAEGTPVEVVLLTGAKVFGTPLRSQPDTAAEFHVLARVRRLFEPPDTVRIPIAGIEVAVSAVPLPGGSQLYSGPRKLGPLPRAGEGFAYPIRRVVAVLTVVALIGAFALVYALTGP